MKKLIVFDLDGTLAPSKSLVDAETLALLHDLLGIVKVAVISGGAWAQFEKQVLSNLPHDDRLANLSLLPTCGTKFFQYAGDWKELYSEDFTPEEKEKIVSSLKKAVEMAGFSVEKTWERQLRTEEARLPILHWVRRLHWQKRTSGTPTLPNGRRFNRSLKPSSLSSPSA